MEEYLILKEINKTNSLNDYILNAQTLQELKVMNIEHEEILDVSSGQISIYCPNRIVEYIKCIRKCSDAKIKINELRIEEMNIMNERCEYCSKDNTENNLRGDDGIVIDKNNKAYIFAEHYRDEVVRITNVNYCPMCGKRL